MDCALPVGQFLAIIFLEIVVFFQKKIGPHSPQTISFNQTSPLARFLEK